MKRFIVIGLLLLCWKGLAEDTSSFPSLPDSPVQFIETLKKADAFYTVGAQRLDYVKESDIPHLMELLDSKEPCAHTKLAASSILSTKRSTVGHEAAYLIEGFLKRFYPTELISERYTPDVERIKSWYVVWSHVKSLAKPSDAANGSQPISAETLEENADKEPPVINAGYAVAAQMRSYGLDVQAIEPRWLYEKQVEKWFPIQSHASAVAVVADTPCAIPKELVEKFRELSVTDKTAEDYVIHGPMLGPQKAYVIFDAQKKPILMIYVHFDVLVTARAHEVSNGDTFQGHEGWQSYSRCAPILEFLRHIDPATEHKTPFAKWHSEGTKATKTE